MVPDRTMQAATLVLGALTRQVVDAIQRGELPETGHSEPHAVVDANTQQSPEGEPAAVPSNQWEHLGSVSTRLTPPPSSRRSDAQAVDQAVLGTQARSRLRRAAVIAPVAVVAAIAAAVLLRMGRDVSTPPSQKIDVESAANPLAPPLLPSAPGPALAAALRARAVEHRPEVRPSRQPGRPITDEIARLDSETDLDYLNRIARVSVQYANAEKMLASEQWLSAQQAFDRLAADYPQFRDVAAKAAIARAKVKEAASSAVASGRRLEDAGDFPAAVREYVRAREFGAEVGTDIDRANSKARSSAEALMPRAKVAENFNRAEAIKLYRQIVALLPAGDPNRTYAEERLRQLTP